MGLTPSKQKHDKYQVMAFFARKSGMSYDEFYEHWTCIHGPKVKKWAKRHNLHYTQIYLNPYLNDGKPPQAAVFVGGASTSTTTTIAAPASTASTATATDLSKTIDKDEETVDSPVEQQQTNQQQRQSSSSNNTSNPPNQEKGKNDNDNDKDKQNAENTTTFPLTTTPSTTKRKPPTTTATPQPNPAFKTSNKYDACALWEMSEPEALSVALRDEYYLEHIAPHESKFIDLGVGVLVVRGCRAGDL